MKSQQHSVTALGVCVVGSEDGDPRVPRPSDSYSSCDKHAQLFGVLLFNYLETSSASCFQGYIIPTQTHTHTLAAVWFDVRKDFLVVDDFSLARWRWSWNQGSSALLPLPHQLNATCVHWDPTSGHPYPSEKIPRPRLSAAAVSIRMEND